MSTDSTSTKTTSGTVAQTTNPWAPQADALTKAFSNAQSAYDSSSSATAPTDFVSQFTPEQLSTFQSMIAQGGDQSVATGQADAGKTLTDAGVSGATGALSGLSAFTAADQTADNVAAANKYVDGQDIDAQVRNAMLSATQTARDVTLPGIEQNAANSGNTNSSRTGIAEGLVQRGLAQQSTDLGATLRSTAFQNGLSLAQKDSATKLAALQGQGALGNATTANGASVGSSSIDNATKLNANAVAGGAGLQASGQAALDNEAAQYQSAVSSPYASLQQLMAVIGGQNWGSSTTGTTTGNEETTKTPSIFEILGGVLGAAGNASNLMPGSKATVNTDVGNGAGGSPIIMYR